MARGPKCSDVQTGKLVLIGDRLYQPPKSPGGGLRLIGKLHPRKPVANRNGTKYYRLIALVKSRK